MYTIEFLGGEDEDPKEKSVGETKSEEKEETPNIPS